MKVCIQNLGKYNEGELLFKWIELPLDEEELNKALDDIQVCNGNNIYQDECGCPYEEYMIADVEDFPFDYSEYMNLEQLNEWAERYENLDDTQKEAFEVFMEGYSEEEALDKAEEGDYMYIEGSNDTELAENYIDEIGGITCLDRDTLERYFDYESFGRDLSYDYTQTSNGYISNY